MRRFLDRLKRSPLIFYTTNYVSLFTPKFIHRMVMQWQLRGVERRNDYAYICERVEYYNQLDREVEVDRDSSLSISEFIAKRKEFGSRYFFDTYNIFKGFDRRSRFVPLFGDIIHVPSIPSIVKSRPIDGDIRNSVVLKLNKLRHFQFLHDTTPFEAKDERSIFYTYALGKPHRVAFLEIYRDREDVCICGNVQHHPEIPERLYRDRVSIEEQLKYRYILALEGNDVATNLKWVMSSNSVAVMPKPRYETWFMEGRLIPGVHYIEIKSDYSDLEEKIAYYNAHPEEAQAIIHNAHTYIDKFRDDLREKLICYLVAQKYLLSCAN